jgi:hypothetical protein
MGAVPVEFLALIALPEFTKPSVGPRRGGKASEEYPNHPAFLQDKPKDNAHAAPPAQRAADQEMSSVHRVVTYQGKPLETGRIFFYGSDDQIVGGKIKVKKNAAAICPRRTSYFASRGSARASRATPHPLSGTRGSS